MEKIQTVKIQDQDYGDTYTVHIQKNGTVWIGWIPEVPEVKCEENTQEELMNTLEKALHKALVNEDEAWEKQLEENVKAGHLDHLLEKAEENFKAGRYYKIEDLQKLLEK